MLPGVCCQNGLVDECGVCGGDNSTCAVTGKVRVQLRMPDIKTRQAIPEVDCSRLLQSFHASVAKALEASPPPPLHDRNLLPQAMSLLYPPPILLPSSPFHSSAILPDLLLFSNSTI